LGIIAAMYDYLIIGQGLAGSLLAWELSQRGKTVCVVDNGHLHSSSRVAAGLINPVTGLRLVKSPHTEAWLQVAGEAYAAMERGFGRILRHQLPMWRLFTDKRQQQAWEERLADPAYADYLGPELAPERARPYLASHGFGQVSHTGWLDTKALLGEMRAWLEGQGAYLQTELDYSAIRLGEELVSWGDHSARRLVFCEGWRGVDNPWFGHLPLTPVKGEILTLKHGGKLPEVIANFGKWLLPVAADRFKLGATYDWEHRDQEVTEQAREHLLAALTDILEIPLATELLDHEAGLRPNTRDRLPLIGAHPEHPRLWVFNGFGSKGSLMIPYYAHHLAEHLEAGVPLDPHCHIGRWDG
jgi:glycine oxidase